MASARVNGRGSGSPPFGIHDERDVLRQGIELPLRRVDVRHALPEIGLDVVGCLGRQREVPRGVLEEGGIGRRERVLHAGARGRLGGQICANPLERGDVLVADGHNGLAVNLELATEPLQRVLRQLAPARTSEVALPALAGQPSLLAPEIRRSCPATSHGAGTGVAHPFRRHARPAVRVLICAAFHTVRVGVPDTLCNSYG